MGDYQAVNANGYRHNPNTGGQSFTAEERYWRLFKPIPALSEVQEDAELDKQKRMAAAFDEVDTAPKTGAYQMTGSVHSISVCGNQPFNFAVTGGTRVQIYDGRTGAMKKRISRFKGTAYSGDLRKEGNLLVAGCENSHISVFNVTTGALMRVFKAHHKSVQVTKWSADKGKVYSCSDDRTFRTWDLSTEKQLASIKAHSDYIRTGAVAGENTFISGSYDKTVKLWDVRDPQTPTLTLDHGMPIEAVLSLKGGSLVCSAAENVIKVWDVLGGGRLVHSFQPHAKAIMSLSLDGTGTRILTGSLDGQVKVIDTSTFASVGQLKDTAGIMCAVANADNSKLITGLNNGAIMIRHRKRGSSRNKATEIEPIAKPPRPGSYRYFSRASSVGPAPGDTMVKRSKKRKLQPFDYHLKKFNYKEALDAALNTRQPYMVANLLSELRQRSGLDAALKGREDAELEPLLAFLVKYVTHPRFAELLLEVAHVILDWYSDSLGHSHVVDELFSKLQKQLSREVKSIRHLLKVSGTLEMLLNSNFNTQ